jgi:hypothetical protein
MVSGNTKNRMRGCCLEGCITVPRNTRLEETSWGREEWSYLMREARAQKWL